MDGNARLHYQQAEKWGLGSIVRLARTTRRTGETGVACHFFPSKGTVRVALADGSTYEADAFNLDLVTPVAMAITVPDLLAALDAMNDAVEEAEEQGDLVTTGKMRDVQVQVRAAIAKARGA